jgi:DNA-binding beta-propeller fold protein YncE
VWSLGALLPATALRGEEPPALVERWGPQGSEPGLFEYPLGIAVDDNDFLYVADTRNHRIQKLQRDGTFVAAWGDSGGGPGQFALPARLVVDPSRGWVYVADAGNGRVQKLDVEGRFVATWSDSGTGPGEFVSPFALAIDPDGFVYVSDTARGDVQKFTSDGNYVTVWRSPLDGGRSFVGALGITANDASVYVTEAGSLGGGGGCHCVMQFTRNGTYLRSWGTFGQAPEQFITPLGVFTDSLHNVYVVDHHNFRIQKFTATGTYLSSWGGRDRTLFIDPHDITVDRRGDLFITDFGGDRGQVMHFSYATSAVLRRSWSDVKRGFRTPRGQP